MSTVLVVVAAVLAAIVLLALAALFIAGERGRLRLSTRQFLRESGFGLRTLHGYVYARWTPQYIKTLFRVTPSAGEPTKAERWLGDHYHGKVLIHEHARAIVNLNVPIGRRDLEKIIPYPTARELMLQAPPDIVVYECVCRHGRCTHCEPTQVCMLVGQPIADFILEHQPDKARRLTREEALALLEAEHQRGHVHSAWFKDAMLNRFYAICNCCKCCCGGIRAMVERGVPMLADSGYVARIDEAVCTNCGECVTACPFRAVTMSDDGAVAQSWERCMGCGVCEVKCATGAITMVRDGRKGVPLDVTTMVGTAQAGDLASARVSLD